MCSELNEQVENLIMNFASEQSLELVECNFKKRGNTVVIDIIADKPNGGITIDECTSFNKEVVRGIEEKQWFGDDFVVEVCSPGLDRALKTGNDFLRAVGRNVRVHLLQSIEGKVEHHGKITKVEENQIVICKNDQMITIPLEHISKAVQVIEFE